MKKHLGFHMELRLAWHSFPDMSRITRGWQCCERVALFLCFCRCSGSFSFSRLFSSIIVRANMFRYHLFKLLHHALYSGFNLRRTKDRSEIHQWEMIYFGAGGVTFFTDIVAIIFLGPPFFPFVLSLAIVSFYSVSMYIQVFCRAAAAVALTTAAAPPYHQKNFVFFISNFSFQPFRFLFHQCFLHQSQHCLW
jgi:hypothetical protein